MRCGDCKHADDEREKDERHEGEPVLRCAVQVPFWVPVSIHDYRSWVRADDGANCNTFFKKDDADMGVTLDQLAARPDIKGLTDAAVAAEREACAALADEYAHLPHGHVPTTGLEAASEAAIYIADAIRARSKKD